MKGRVNMKIIWNARQHRHMWLLYASVLATSCILFWPTTATANWPAGAVTFGPWTSGQPAILMQPYTWGYCFLLNLTETSPSSNAIAQVYVQGTQSPYPPYNLVWEITGTETGGASASGQAICIPWTTLNPHGKANQGDFTFANWFNTGVDTTVYAASNHDFCGINGIDYVLPVAGDIQYHVDPPIWNTLTCSSPGCYYNMDVAQQTSISQKIDWNCVRPYGTTEFFGAVGAQDYPPATLFSTIYPGWSPPLTSQSICNIEQIYVYGPSWSAGIEDSGGQNGVWTTTGATVAMECINIPTD